MNDTLKLVVTPEVVAEIKLADDAERLMAEVLNKKDFDLWSQYAYGSGYYIELPHYLNGLIQTGKSAEARAVIKRSFAGDGISQRDWRKMVKYRLVGKLG